MLSSSLPSLKALSFHPLQYPFPFTFSKTLFFHPLQKQSTFTLYKSHLHLSYPTALFCHPFQSPLSKSPLLSPSPKALYFHPLQPFPFTLSSRPLLSPSPKALSFHPLQHSPFALTSSPFLSPFSKALSFHPSPVHNVNLLSIFEISPLLRLLLDILNHRSNFVACITTVHSSHTGSLPSPHSRRKPILKLFIVMQTSKMGVFAAEKFHQYFIFFKFGFYYTQELQ